MKFSAVALFASIGSVSAFVVSPDVAIRSASSLSMASDSDQWNEPGRVKKLPIKSQALPFINSPATLDGSMAGDRGFDPFGFAGNKERLTEMREAEVKHARLAMLAAAGWPLSELWDKKIAMMLDLPPLLDATTGRVPSVLNGGLGKVSPVYWIGCLALAGACEAYGGVVASQKKGYFPGNFGFDPLGLYPKDVEAQKQRQLSEIKHGRLAMIAITAFAAQEYVDHTAVVDHAAIFFKPITQVIGEASLPGLYVAPPTDVPDGDAAIDAVNAAVEAASSIGDAVSAATDAASTAATDAADAVSSAATAAVEAVTPPPAVVEAVTQLPPIDATPPPASASSAELEVAKARIAELEAKLSQIAEFSR
mmetsp:Transcript_17681/g.19367  ORF Transcript_17681/g.19367 Transcript_17681/m.19367 type:complete len:365 (-) Transcript_17681:319-1413(-)